MPKSNISKIIHSHWKEKYIETSNIFLIQQFALENNYATLKSAQKQASFFVCCERERERATKVFNRQLKFSENLWISSNMQITKCMNSKENVLAIEISDGCYSPLKVSKNSPQERYSTARSSYRKHLRKKQSTIVHPKCTLHFLISSCTNEVQKLENTEIPKAIVSR